MAVAATLMFPAVNPEALGAMGAFVLAPAGTYFTNDARDGATAHLVDAAVFNVIGMGLATALRFWSFRHLVFHVTAPECLPKGVHRIGADAQ